MTRLFAALPLCLITLALACDSAAPAPAPGTQDTAATRVVFHTQSAMLVASVSPADAADEHGWFREVVRDYYPAVCLDVDRDEDGLPDATDHSFDDSAEASDAGTGPVDADEPTADRALRCKRCNRGPLNSADFRYEERGARADLDRGRVLSMTATQVVVAGPGGAVTIEYGEKTDLDTKHGALAPGAEIRARGTLRQNAVRTIEAERLDVLCPGPGIIPESEIPAGVPVAPPAPTDAIN